MYSDIYSSIHPSTHPHNDRSIDRRRRHCCRRYCRLMSIMFSSSCCCCCYRAGDFDDVHACLQVPYCHGVSSRITRLPRVWPSCFQHHSNWFCTKILPRQLVLAVHVCFRPPPSQQPSSRNHTSVVTTIMIMAVIITIVHVAVICTITISILSLIMLAVLIVANPVVKFGSGWAVVSALV